MGLKGSDGPQVLARARQLGASPESPKRAVEALRRIACLKDSIEVTTYPYEMGENEAREAGFDPIVIGSVVRGNTTPEDTEKAARDMARLKVDLLLFAGGDGTARNICSAIGDEIPVLGIPSGVKIHSAVYARNPKSAGDLVLMFLEGQPVSFREAEVMDIDEDAFRQGFVSAKLYGYLKVLYESTLVQGLKSGGVQYEQASLEGLAEWFVEEMEDDYFYVIGPGTTTRAITDHLGLEKTLLGVDVIYKGEVLEKDVSEADLLRLLKRKGAKVKIVVTPIGGQGYVFGRGNQQISPEVIKAVGKKNIVVVSSKDKIVSLGNNPLLVDMGDDEVNEMLGGYIKVMTGYREEVVCRVAS